MNIRDTGLLCLYLKVKRIFWPRPISVLCAKCTKPFLVQVNPGLSALYGFSGDLAEDGVRFVSGSSVEEGESNLLIS